VQAFHPASYHPASWCAAAGSVRTAASTCLARSLGAMTTLCQIRFPTRGVACASLGPAESLLLCASLLWREGPAGGEREVITFKLEDGRSDSSMSVVSPEHRPAFRLYWVHRT